MKKSLGTYDDSMAEIGKRSLAVCGIICAIMCALPVYAQEGAPPQTGTDPRDFAPKFMPYYRYTELKNGLENQSLILFGLYAFTTKFAMTYEIPVGYKNDVTGTALNNGDDTCGPGGSFTPGEGLPPISIPGVTGNCQETGELQYQSGHGEAAGHRRLEVASFLSDYR